ncbi:BapA/Bap/LapF family prefix-like domain-containing protein, partial [Comamonas sp. NoAH]|uniref:BapA/Bap/LapF family prefix-like domain-containing protein n=1 Tax=Comamonas halotolerans TaxID=3041496 RepID=UPI0024E145B9
MLDRVNPVEIVVVSKKTTVSKFGMPHDFRLDSAAVVQINVTRAEVKEMIRMGNDLVVKLHNGETITVRDFFTQLDGGQSHLVLQDDVEGLWLAEFGAGEGNVSLGYSNLQSIDPLLAGEAHDEVLPVLLTLGSGMAGFLAVHLVDSDRRDGNADTTSPAEPVVNPVNAVDPITGT